MQNDRSNVEKITGHQARLEDILTIPDEESVKNLMTNQKAFYLAIVKYKYICNLIQILSKGDVDKKLDNFSTLFDNTKNDLERARSFMPSLRMGLEVLALPITIPASIMAVLGGSNSGCIGWIAGTKAGSEFVDKIKSILDEESLKPVKPHESRTKRPLIRPDLAS